MTSTVGVPTEIKDSEHRVAITPDGVRELVHHEIRVLVQAGAGAGAGIADAEYQSSRRDDRRRRRRPCGATPTSCARSRSRRSPSSRYLRDDLVLFTYLHLAAYPEVAKALLRSRCTAVAYETVQTADGALPLLAPDERGRRAHGHPGGRPLPREGERRSWRPARWRARRAPGTGGRARRRQRRLERGVDRGGHGGRGRPARQEHRPAALGRPDPQGPDPDARVEQGRGRARGRRRRPAHRRGARARRPGADARHRRHGRGDAARFGPRRRRHRPRRLRRGHPRDDPHRSRSTCATTSSTTRSATSRARCRTRRRTPSPTRRSRISSSSRCTGWPKRRASIRALAHGVNTHRGSVTHPAVAEALGVDGSSSPRHSGSIDR